MLYNESMALSSIFSAFTQTKARDRAHLEELIAPLIPVSEALNMSNLDTGRFIYQTQEQTLHAEPEVPVRLDFSV